MKIFKYFATIILSTILLTGTVEAAIYIVDTDKGTIIESSEMLGVAPRVLRVSQGGTSTSTFVTGDIIFSDTTDGLDSLPIGSVDQVLTVSGGLPTWAASSVGEAFAWTPAITYNENANSTSTPIWFQDTIYASSTSFLQGIINAGLDFNVDSDTFFVDAENDRISIMGQENTTTVNGVTKGSTFTSHITGGSQDYTWVSHVHSNTVGPVMAGGRSRGSEASPSQVSSGDNLLDLLGLGFDGTDNDYLEFSAIHLDVDDIASPGNDDAPGMITFLTTPDGSTSLAEHMRIDQVGNIGIGDTSPTYKLTVNGDAQFASFVDASYFVATSTASTSTFNGIDWTYSSSSAFDLTLSRIGDSTFSTVQDLQNIFHSAGWVSGGTIADIGGSAVSVSAGTGLIRTSNSATALTSYFDWTASTTIDIPADSVRYIGIEYNSGSPRVTSRTTYNWDLKTDFPLVNIVNEGGTLHLENAPQAVGDHAANMIERTFESLGKQRDNLTGGLIIGETGSRNVTMSAGTLWERLTSFDLSAIDTSGAGTFDTYCGTTKNETATSTWDNLNYCNAGSLTALANNRYAVLWFYIELDGGLIMQYGTAQYVSEAGAEAEGVPATITDRALVQSKLIGRFIFQESGSTAESIESVFATTFAGAIVTDHGNLAGLTDDDHTQYLLVDGTRAMTGGINPNGNNTLDLGAFGTAWQNIFVSSTAYLDYVSSTALDLSLLTMSGNIVMGDNTISGIDALTFTDTAGTIAGIANGNLADLIASQSWTGLNQFTNVSTSLFSVYDSAFFGATATSTFSSDGSLTMPTTATLTIPATANPTVNAIGEMAWDSTTNTLKVFGDEEYVFSPFPPITPIHVTSTAWTGTTTMLMGPAEADMTFTEALCETIGASATVNVSLYDGTNRADMITASNTVGFFKFSTNNTFVKGESIRVDFGTPASSPTQAVCKFLRKYTP